MSEFIAKVCFVEVFTNETVHRCKLELWGNNEETANNSEHFRSAKMKTSQRFKRIKS